jgi:ATP-dependent Clp protease ATP-binding subunit ClpC
MGLSRYPGSWKSGVASFVSVSLFLSSAGGPATSAFAQAVRGPASVSGAARVGAPAPVSLPALGVAPLSLPEQGPNAQIPAPTPAAGATPAPAEAPAPAPAPAKLPTPTASDGPRWVGNPKGGFMGWIRARLGRPTRVDGEASRRLFDGENSRGESREATPESNLLWGRSGSGSGLHVAHPFRAISAIVENHAVPTPQAAREVGALRVTPLWAKVVAPLSVLAAAAVAVQVGAVGALTLGAGLVFSVLAHEVAHLAVLKALGDHTAEHAGSHSLNPLNHIDAIKTVIWPSLSLAVSSLFFGAPVLIGAAKPVDADFNQLRGPLGGPRSARNAFWVAAAGPLMNLALAGLFFGAAALLPAGGALAVVAGGLWKMNLALAAFNALIPLPQLDGGKMLASVLPASWYARWVYNPRIEKGYQGLFQRLYQGPSNLLTFLAEKLGVSSQQGLNRLANAVTFAALGVFYAAAYAHFSVALPLLFLALPCTYDYWCIREKVRSEAAVKDIQELSSQWSSVIGQIAEDMGMDSEVNAFEAEHAMKNALETLIDQLMADADFRALSTEDKIQRLMTEYPGEAADFLKDKVFTEAGDTREKILALLRDGRNGPFYDRLRKWLRDHDIFERWDNPAYGGKLKDEMKEGGKPKEKSQGGFIDTRLLMVMGAVVGAASFFPELFQHWPALAAAAGFAGVAGSLEVTGDDDAATANWLRKLRLRPSDPDGRVRVVFMPIVNLHSIPRDLLPGITTHSEPAGQRVALRFDEPDGVAAAQVIKRLLASPLVDSVTTGEALYNRVSDLPQSAQPSVAPEPVPAAAPHELSDEEIEAAATARDEAGVWREKIKGPPLAAPGDLAVVQFDSDAYVTFVRDTPPEVRERVISHLRQMDNVTSANAQADGVVIVRMRLNQNDYAEAVEEVGSLKAVASVAVSTNLRDRFFAIPLPANILNHGKEHFSTTCMLVRFASDATAEMIATSLGVASADAALRYGEYYVDQVDNRDKVSERARFLAAQPGVAAVEVHPNAAYLLENRLEVRYPAAQSYDPRRVVLAQFKTGTTEAEIKEYAEHRGLRLVYPAYRGKVNLALLEIIRTSELAATRQMIVDEMLEDASKVVDIKTFKEQLGDNELTPTPGAVARAAARKTAAEAARKAADEAARHTPRRDARAEWVKFLQNRKLSDGSTLNPKAVDEISALLRPVARAGDEKRGPIVGRTAEIKRLLPIVTAPRGMRNSAILVGPLGVGKTAIAEGLAEMIEDAHYAQANDAEQYLQFQRLKDRWVVELDVNEVLTADDPVGVMKMVVRTLPLFNDADPTKGNAVIVLIDDIQKIFEHQKGDQMMSILLGPLRDGKISVIGTTPEAFYKKYFDNPDKDTGLKRRMEKIVVEEPSVEQTTTILRAKKTWYEGLHDAVISDNVLVQAAKLSDQFDKENFNPDKAEKAVHDAAEKARPENRRADLTLDIREIWSQLAVAIDDAKRELVEAGVAATVALSAETYNRITGLVKKALTLYERREKVADGRGIVDVDAVKDIIGKKTGIASGQLGLADDDPSRYVDMEAKLGESIVNQEAAIRVIADAIRNNKAGLSDGNGPIGKFLLAGPTGVGKTFLAKKLAEFLFNDPEAMTRIDMSEFMEPHSVARLIGAPPGYVGYDKGGFLTEAVRKKPYSVVLLDEVEKAHPDVFNILLQVFDDGRLTDGQGRTADFKNVVFLMTTNAGMMSVDSASFARRIRDARKLASEHGGDAAAILRAGFKIEQEWDRKIDEAVAASILGGFRPEFLNRLDDGPPALDEKGQEIKDEVTKVKWTRVNRLRRQDMEKIAALQVAGFKKILSERHDADLIVDQSVIDFLAEEGFSHLLGARPMKGAVDRYLRNPLGRWILTEVKSGVHTVQGGQVTVTREDGRIVFKAQPKPASTLARETVADAAALLSADVFDLVERLAAGERGEAPGEGVFDRLLRAVRAAAAPAAPVVAAAKEQAFLAPQRALDLPATAQSVGGSHNRSKAVDVELRNESRRVADAVRAAGRPDLADALVNPAGTPGEGWLKQITALMKESAQKVGATEPVSIVSSLDGEGARVLVHSDAELSAEDVAQLNLHFTGTPPQSYEAAQQYVDALSPTSRVVRNHNLLDVYRRLKAVPGARMGYASGAQARGGRGSDIWLEVRKLETPAPEAAPAAEPAETAPQADVVTPHHERELAKARELLMRVISPKAVTTKYDQDGPAIAIAAAESYARLSGPEQLLEARAWIKEHKWAEAGTALMALTSRSTLVMTAVIILGLLGSDEDIPVLEAISAKVTDTSHNMVPLHGAMATALARRYLAAGLPAVRQAAVRVSQIVKGVDRNDADAKRGLSRALGFLGYPSDYEEIRRDGEGLAELYRRMGSADQVRAEFYSDEKWNKADGARKNAILELLLDAEPNEKTFELLAGSLLGNRGSERETRYHVAQTWANFMARSGQTKAIGEMIQGYLKTHKGIDSHENGWAVLYAYVLAAEKAGGADVLPALEQIMNYLPGGINSNHEQMYFSTPEAWAHALVRGGKFAEYARKQLKDGKLGPSKLEEMLYNKDRPMLAAAALRAFALARDPHFKPVQPKADATNIPRLSFGATASHGGMYGNY